MTDGPRPAPPLGTTVADRYRIDGLIARGGMARVYRARDLRLERDVALKILSPPFADDPTFIERFLAEARAAASLSHPSLAHVYDSGSDGDVHFIVMELLDQHRSLRAELDERGRLERQAVVHIGRELLAGLRVVHERGLVHCDVKSGNVMLGPGPAKLIDFGIAWSPERGVDGDATIGSLGSMSPEQLRGDPLTPASDLFSLGVVLYEARAGRMPFPGDTADQVSEAHSAPLAPPSSFTADPSDRLDDAILQALRPDPAARFHSTEAMARALEAAADERDVASEMDETQPMDAASAPRTRPQSDVVRDGYVPPALPPLAQTSLARPARPPAHPRPVGSRPSGLPTIVGTLIVLAAAAAVIAFVVLPLLNLGGGPGEPLPSSTASPGAPGAVLVPETVGMATRDAIEAATQAGLEWTVRCNQDPKRPEGIVDQEPPAGTPVAPGSTFTMYSARVSDCR